jgi:hypothetical protein
VFQVPVRACQISFTRKTPLDYNPRNGVTRAFFVSPSKS